MEKIISPLTSLDNVTLIREVEPHYLIKKYKEAFNVDVDAFFDNKNDSVKLYKCNDTGYSFYYPFSLSGDGKFYEKLSNADWYYMPWKWEHEQTSMYVKSNTQVLEVGCGQGDFLKKIQSDDIITTGIELNKKAIELANKNGVNVLEESVQSHAKSNAQKYDIVCSFQVLEHITEVKPFLEVCIKCLKKGGKLIIGVPNNDSFLKFDWKNDLLNMPPHHMGLWNTESLQNLEKVFNIKLLDIQLEPLQSYHIDWYQSIFERMYLKNRVIGSVYYRTKLNKVFKYYITRRAHKITGHTVLATYSV